MAIKCEKCERINPETYPRGPFIGMPMELPYCKYCSMDLCESCMEKKTCTESPYDGEHEVEDDDGTD